MMTVNDVLGSTREEQVEVYLKVLSQYFTRGTNENHAAFELWVPALRPESVPIWSQSVLIRFSLLETCLQALADTL
jgi:hypothetical protein